MADKSFLKLGYSFSQFQKEESTTEGWARMAASRSEEFGVLKWKDYHVTVATTFKMLKDEEDFLDVTLVCDEENQICAHKVSLIYPLLIPNIGGCSRLQCKTKKKVISTYLKKIS